MKKMTILGLTLILLFVLVACSTNNKAEVGGNEHTEEHVDDSVEVTKPAAEPKNVGVVVEPKVEAKPEVVEPKEKPAAVEPEAVEPKEQPPAAVEPTPVVATPKIHKVEIVKFAFSPESLEISVGDIVEFTNLDKVKHSVVEDNGVFDTGLLGQNESKQVTFSEAGEFGYYCGPHPNMRAKIIVK